MAYHVPFSQRHRQPPGPIYIGFDEPPRFQRRRYNWWGFNGLLLSIAGLMTCGLLAPLSLLISLIGLRRSPRGAALTGTLISLAGLGLIVSMVIGGLTENARRQSRIDRIRQSRQVAEQVDQCRALLNEATDDLADYRNEHNGVLPSAIDGNVLIIKYVDPWEMELRYEELAEGGLVRSAGPDRQFDTPDDVTAKIQGKSNVEPLLPIDD